MRMGDGRTPSTSPPDGAHARRHVRDRVSSVTHDTLGIKGDRLNKYTTEVSASAL